MQSENSLKLIEIKSKDMWNQCLSNFDDANVYQTWSFPKVALSENNFQHLALFSGDDLIGLALVRLKSLSILQLGFAYVFRGPLWQFKNKKNDISQLNNIFEELFKEFTIKRNLYLRIRPFLFFENGKRQEILNKAYFTRNNNILPYRSIRLSLLDSLDKIEGSFRRTWRQELHKSQKNNLIVTSGNDDKLFEIFLDNYHEMHNRKKFHEYVNIDKFRKLQHNLDESQKLKIFIALSNSQPAASLAISAIGDTGIAISGGTNELGLRTNASYLLQWEAIKWLKSIGCKYYDLGGINRIKNPGGYVWKTGISKIEIEEVGIFDSYNKKLLKNMIYYIDKYKAKKNAVL